MGEVNCVCFVRRGQVTAPFLFRVGEAFSASEMIAPASDQVSESDGHFKVKLGTQNP